MYTHIYFKCEMLAPASYSVTRAHGREDIV